MKRMQLMNVIKEKITAFEHETAQQSQVTLQQAVMAGRLDAISHIEIARKRMRTIAMHAQENVEKNVLSASIKAAKNMTIRELNENTASMIKLSKQALHVVKEAQKVRIMVHPNNHHTVLQHKDQLIESLDLADYVDIREDSSIEPGGLVVHTEVGSIDAQPSTLVSEIARAILE